MKLPKQNSKIKRFIKHIYIAALVTGAAILFYACENNIEEIKALVITDDKPLAEAIDVFTQETDSGKIVFTLKAPLVQQFKVEGKEFAEFPEGIELTKYNEDGKVVSSIKANYAKQNVLENTWEARYNVVATNVQGDTLKTEHLIYEQNSGAIESNEYVEIISEDKIMYGEGLTSDEEMQGWNIKKPKGTIYVTVDEGEPQSTNQQTTQDEVNSTNEKQGNGELQFEK